jgi:DNA-binding beta-propeller fold protein YncE
VLALALLWALPAGASELYVLSQGTQQVLEYDAANGSFGGPFASTVTEGFRTPGGIAVRPSDGVLYVSSISTGEIWSYTTATGAPIQAVATGLFAPFGIDFDAAGSQLYFVDAASVISELTDAVKKLDVASGIVTSVGSNSQADFLAVAVNGSHVFATDVAQDRIIRFPVAGGSGTVVVSSGLSSPSALLFATPTQMLVADSGSDRVLEYLESGGSWIPGRVVLPASAGLHDPAGLALAPDGQLTVSARQSGDVVSVHLSTLVASPLVSAGAGGLSDPAGLAWSSTVLLVASPSGNAVFSFDAAGQPTGVRADGLSASLDAGITLSPDGTRLFVGSIGGNDVLEYDVATGARVRSFVQACPNLPLPFDVVLGDDGKLYVSCTLNSSIEHFDASTGVALGSFVISGMGGLQSPRSLTFGPSGNLFVANGNGAVLEFDGSSGASLGTFGDTDGSAGGPVDSYGLRFQQGALYVTSLATNEVKAYDASTGAFLSTFVTAGSGGLSGPAALDFGPDGDLYVASQNDDAVRRYDGATGAFVEVFVPSGSGGLDSPFDLEFAPAEGPQPVPALPTGGRLLLCAGLVAAAATNLRRAGMQREARA